MARQIAVVVSPNSANFRPKLMSVRDSNVSNAVAYRAGRLVALAGRHIARHSSRLCDVSNARCGAEVTGRSIIGWPTANARDR
jgi:hypothetical protein